MPGDDSSRSLAIQIDHRSYVVGEPLDPKDPLVIKVRQTVSETLTVAQLIKEMSQAADLLNVAHLAAANYNRIQNSIWQILASLQSAIGRSDATMIVIGDQAGNVLSILADVFDYLFSGDVELAVTTLKECADCAGRLAEAAEKMAAEFDGLADKTKIVVGDAQGTTADEKRRIAALADEILKQTAEKAALEQLTKSYAAQKDQVAQLYADAKQRAETAEERAFISDLVGGIFSAVGAGLAAYASASTPKINIGTQPVPVGQSLGGPSTPAGAAGHEADADPTIDIAAATDDDADAAAGDDKAGDDKTGEAEAGEAKTDDDKAGDAKAGEAEAGDAKAGEAKAGEAKAGEAKEGEAKAGDAKAGDAKAGEAKEGEAKEGEAKEGEVKEGEAKAGETKAGDTKAGAKKSEDAAADKAKPAAAKPAPTAAELAQQRADHLARTKGVGAAATDISAQAQRISAQSASSAVELRKQVSQLLNLQFKIEEKNRDALAKMARFTVLIGGKGVEKSAIEISVASLSQSIGALQQVTAILLAAATYWRGMEAVCRRLDSEGDFQKKIGRLGTMTEAQRTREFQRQNFLKSAVEYSAAWKALECIAGDYRTELAHLGTRVKGYVGLHPSEENARKEATRLAAELGLDVSASLNAKDAKLKQIADARASLTPDAVAGTQP